MNSPTSTAGFDDEIWFLTSELEGERAGSFRQERWCQIFLSLQARISIYNVAEGGAFRLREFHFDSPAAFAEFRRQTTAATKSAASIREGWKVRLLRRMKHLFMVDLYYPNIFRLVFRAARRLRATPRRVVLMSSSPPFSLALAGAVLKSLYPERVVLAIDMRDPWSLHQSLGGIKPLKRWIERWALRRANLVSTVSHGLREEFAETHGVAAKVLYNVASHYSTRPEAGPVDWGRLNPAIAVDRLKLVYTGSTPEGFYDLVALAGAVKKLRLDSAELADRLQLVFVGACAEMQREAIRQEVQSGDIVFVPHVSHAVARSIQQAADALLFLTYRGRGAVSTKIFEYMALGRPIFPVAVPTNSDADHLLRTYCGTCHNLHTVAEISAALGRLAAGNSSLPLPRLADPQALQALLGEYRQHAEQLLAKARTPC